MTFWSYIFTHAKGSHILFLAALALATRILPRLFCPEARGFDAYFHLIAARGIRRNRFRIPKKWPEYLLPGIYDYPPLYLYLVALFPVRWHLAVEKWSSAVIDAVHGLVVYGFAIYWLGVLQPVADPVTKALWVSLLFLFSPALTGVGTGPRAYQGTPRTLGELQFTLAMAAAVCYQAGGGQGAFVLAAFFGGTLFLTSKFGVQVYGFILPLLFVLQLDPVWLLVGAAGVCMAFLLSFGHYLVVLRGHVGHSRYYQAVIAPRFHMVRNFNRWEDIRNLWANLRQNPRRAVKTLLMDNSYTQLVIKHPQLFYLAYLFVAGFPGSAGTGRSTMAGWLGAGVLAFALTSLKPLRFLGEADRYLEYTLVPQFLLLAGSASFLSLARGLAGYEALMYLLFVVIFILQFKEDARRLPAFREMAAFVRHNPAVSRLLPIYLGEGNQLAYETEKGVAHFPASLVRKNFAYEKFLSFYEKVYPFPAEDLLGLVADYGFDAVYFSKADLARARNNGIEYDFSGWQTVFENGTYTVLRPPGDST